MPKQDRLKPALSAARNRRSERQKRGRGWAGGALVGGHGPGARCPAGLLRTLGTRLQGHWDRVGSSRGGCGTELATRHPPASPQSPLAGLGWELVLSPALPPGPSKVDRDAPAREGISSPPTERPCPTARAGPRGSPGPAPPPAPPDLLVCWGAGIRTWPIYLRPCRAPAGRRATRTPALSRRRGRPWDTARLSPHAARPAPPVPGRSPRIPRARPAARSPGLTRLLGGPPPDLARFSSDRAGPPPTPPALPHSLAGGAVSRRTPPLPHRPRRVPGDPPGPPRRPLSGTPGLVCWGAALRTCSISRPPALTPALSW